MSVCVCVCIDSGWIWMLNNKHHPSKQSLLMPALCGPFAGSGSCSLLPLSCLLLWHWLRSGVLISFSSRSRLASSNRVPTRSSPRSLLRAGVRELNAHYVTCDLQGIPPFPLISSHPPLSVSFSSSLSLYLFFSSSPYSLLLTSIFIPLRLAGWGPD